MKKLALVVYLAACITFSIGAAKAVKPRSKATRSAPQISLPLSCFWNNGSENWSFTGTYDKGGNLYANAILPMNCSYGNSIPGCEANVDVFVLWQATPWMPWTKVWTKSYGQISPCNTGNFKITVSAQLAPVDGYYEIYAEFNSCGYDENGYQDCNLPGMRTYYKAFTQFRVWQGKFVGGV